MDEIKRAIELAEQIPFRFLIQHIGLPNESYNERKIEAAMTSVEHLRAFAKPLGVRVLLENIPNDLSSPERLLEFIRVTHFDDVGVCFDTGHAHMYFFKMGKTHILGSSPEMLVRVTGRKLEYRPIAGTHPRGKDDAEDRKLEEKMLRDDKERAEHVMLVDLGRNDLGRVSEFGSVKVKDLMYVERYSHVMKRQPV